MNFSRALSVFNLVALVILLSASACAVREDSVSLTNPANIKDAEFFRGGYCKRGDSRYCQSDRDCNDPRPWVLCGNDNCCYISK